MLNLTHSHTHWHSKGQAESSSGTEGPLHWGPPVTTSKPYLLVVPLSGGVISNLETVQVHKVLEVVGVPSPLTDEQSFVKQEGIPGGSQGSLSGSSLGTQLPKFSQLST